MYRLQFSKDKRGNIATTMAFVLMPLSVIVGFALDYSAAVSQRQNLQRALDSGVLAAAIDRSSNQADREAVGIQAAFANFSGNCENLEFEVSLTDEQTASGVGHCDSPTDLLGLIGRDHVRVSLTSAAQRVSQPTPICLLALNEYGSNIQSTGTAAIDASGCEVRGNSTSPTAFNMGGTTSLKSQRNCVVGGVYTGGSSTLSPPAETDCDKYPDPFLNIATPPVSGCDYNNYSFNGSSHTLSPGTYCGGIRLAAGSFTFDPGVYIIRDGFIEVRGGADLSGSEVTFYMVGSDVGLDLAGGGSLDLTPSSSGLLDGFLVYADPTATSSTPSKIRGGAGMDFGGAIYLPRAHVELSGNGALSASPFNIAIAAGSFELKGTSDLYVSYDPANSIGLPDELFPDDLAARLVE